MKETKERHRDRETVCHHQDVSVVTPPALCTWVSSPTGILDYIKVLNRRTHHNRHTHSQVHRMEERWGKKENFSE